jgi:opacity protein-like surface antigen
VRFTLKLWMATAIFANTASYALDPAQGFYGGLFLGGSYSQPVKFDFTHPLTSAIPITGQLKYSVYGNAGGEIGYRMNLCRAEVELLYNHSPYHSISINNQTFTSQKSGDGFRYKGQTNTGALMINAFYDLYFTAEEYNFVPYLGLGIGYANVQNSINFYCDNKKVGNNIAVVAPDGTCTLVHNPHARKVDNSTSHGGGAAQAILGVNYFMDDFITFGLDIRQFATKNTPPFNSRTQFTSLNLSFNGAFDFG